MESTWQKQAVAEFVGTFALVFIGAGSVVIANNGASDLVGVALAHGIVLAVMVSVLGHISGGHFNPAVTAAVWVVRKIDSPRAVLYVLVQLVAAAAAGLVLRGILPEDLWHPAERADLGNTLVAAGAGMTVGKAVLLEAVLTFFLVIAVFGTAVDDRGAFGKVAGLSIGLVLTFDILMGGPLTGASMNPARTFGPALASARWDDFWVYVAGPVGGAVIAATLYWFAFLRDRERVTAPPSETPTEATDQE